MDKFRAYRIDEQDGKIVAGFQELSLDDLTEGNVVVRVTHSTINYKDALAATGKGRILRRYPLNGGIDFAGVVVSSDDEELQPGTEVAMTRCRWTIAALVLLAGCSTPEDRARTEPLLPAETFRWCAQPLAFQPPPAAHTIHGPGDPAITRAVMVSITALRLFRRSWT